MLKQSRCVWMIVLWTLMLFPFTATAEEQGAEGQQEGPVPADCAAYYEKNGTCPNDVCVFDCLQGVIFEGCKKWCEPKPCFEIEAENCPEDFCQVVTGCEGKDVCFPLNDYVPPKCGGLAYSGADVECCPGLVKRCGIEFFDGSCDMVGKYSMDSIPMCIPCGNGVCNQFENACNCPEDCHKEFATDIEYKGFKEEAKEEDAEEGAEEGSREDKKEYTEKDKAAAELLRKYIPQKRSDQPDTKSKKPSPSKE